LGIGGVLQAFSNLIVNGKVGIGTVSPQGKLDLNGSLAVGGNQGSAGQVLQSQGAGITPVWATAAITSGTYVRR